MAEPSRLGPKLTTACTLIALSLGTGFVAGRISSSASETAVIPPATFRGNSAQMLDEVCTKNSAYAALTASEGHHERKLITRLQITATPVSDRGVVCRLTGMMIAQQGQVGSMTFTKEPLQATIIVAVTGDAELVSEDFASALLNSPSIAAMASNVGNDGEVVPKYNVY